MSDLLLTGSLAAAFGGGMVAFFAPCCAGVMLPAYLAAIGGGRRLRVARLTAVYILGLAVVVLPITLGAAALASSLSRWHPQLFTAGGLMMLAVAITLWRGTMISVPLPQPRLTGSVFSVLVLGMFSGGATACCAPVLAGAIALSLTSGSLVGGLLLGVAYVAGMMAPLIPIALLVGEARERVGDPRVFVRLGGYRKSIGLSRLLGAIVFVAFGVLFIVLALTGNAETAPAFQYVLGSWIRGVTAGLGAVPNYLALPVLAVLVVAFGWAVVRRGSRSYGRPTNE